MLWLAYRDYDQDGFDDGVGDFVYDDDGSDDRDNGGCTPMIRHELQST